MTKLAIIPSDPIETYEKEGISSWLEDYYNPKKYFDKVYLFSPLEARECLEFGMRIIPTKPVELKKRLKQFDIDLVRVYGGHWPCDMACKNRIRGIPVIVSVHDTNPRMLHSSIKNAHFVWCTSRAVKNLVLKKYHREKNVWILPNRVNLEIFKPIDNLDIFRKLNKRYPFRYKILHVGRKSQQKNLDTLIKSLKILGKEYCILFIGRGNCREYEKLARDLDVIRQCYFIESIPNEELPVYYSWADCMCTPSRWEGFGIVFVEALACEATVVTSDIAPMNEYIEHMKNGFLVKDYENPQAISKMIKIACCDKQVKEALRKNTRGSIEQFEKSKIDQLEVDYYRKILAMKQNNEFNLPFYKRLLSRKKVNM